MDLTRLCMAYVWKFVGHVWNTPGFAWNTYRTSRNIQEMHMELHRMCMEYIWNRIRYQWSMHGTYVYYFWNMWTCMEHAWIYIEYVCNTHAIGKKTHAEPMEPHRICNGIRMD